MKEVILKQIQIATPALIFYSVFIFIPIIVIILTLTIKKLKIKPLLNRLAIYLVLSVIMFMGVISFAPLASLTFNLVRDYHYPTILVKEGVVERMPSRAKIPMIKIDNEQFFLSSRIGKAEDGEYCVIEYFKYSKYVYSIKINP